MSTLILILVIVVILAVIIIYFVAESSRKEKQRADDLAYKAQVALAQKYQSEKELFAREKLNKTVEAIKNEQQKTLDSISDFDSSLDVLSDLAKKRADNSNRVQE